jgi:hypothetical protein
MSFWQTVRAHARTDTTEPEFEAPFGTVRELAVRLAASAVVLVVLAVAVVAVAELGA